MQTGELNGCWKGCWSSSHPGSVAGRQGLQQVCPFPQPRGSCTVSWYSVVLEPRLALSQQRVSHARECCAYLHGLPGRGLVAHLLI